MAIEVLTAPGLEMRTALGASTAWFDFARSTATVVAYVVSVIAFFTVAGDAVAAKFQLVIPSKIQADAVPLQAQQLPPLTVELLHV
jgi:hypothetical protein